MKMSALNCYRLAILLFSTLFIGSVVLCLADLRAAYDEFHHLGYPEWIVHPLNLAKMLGVIAIVSNRSKRLKDFAFAGFLFDLLCALGGHIAQQEAKVILPILGLCLWAFAFLEDSKKEKAAWPKPTAREFVV
jgi:DoxX-like family